jgi:hypothetical protein
MVMAQQADPKRKKSHKSIAQQWSDFWNSEYPEGEHTALTWLQSSTWPGQAN